MRPVHAQVGHVIRDEVPLTEAQGHLRVGRACLLQGRCFNLNPGLSNDISMSVSQVRKTYDS